MSFITKKVKWWLAILIYLLFTGLILLAEVIIIK